MFTLKDFEAAVATLKERHHFVPTCLVITQEQLEEIEAWPEVQSLDWKAIGSAITEVMGIRLLVYGSEEYYQFMSTTFNQRGEHGI